MFNVYEKKIVIKEIVHMNEKTGIGVSSEKEKVKESQSCSVTPLLDTPLSVGLGALHNTLLDAPCALNVTQSIYLPAPRLLTTLLENPLSFVS